MNSYTIESELIDQEQLQVCEQYLAVTLHR